MSVSYFQIMYKKDAGEYQIVENTPNVGLYELNALVQCDSFQEFIKNKYGRRTYNFAGDENLIEKQGQSPMSIDYLTPNKIQEDLNIYSKFIEDLKLEIANPQNSDLQKGIVEWFIDEESLNRISKEIFGLWIICNFAQINHYAIKFGVDY